MYKAFYSLSKVPFSKEISVDDLFLSTSFNEGLARLEYLKNTRGIGVLVGEPGSGKTTLLRKFSSTFNSSMYKVIYFQLSTVTVSDFYRGLTYGLGQDPRFRKVDLFAQIQQSILNFYHNQNITPIVILDELHMASNNFLGDISLLFNFSMDSQNPFVLCLAGLPHLMDRLKLTHMQSLNQRIAIRHRMNPLSMEEVENYITHHLKTAGASQMIFMPDAIEAIASRSRCYPRLINNIAIHALNYGYAKKLEKLDAEAVYAAVTELEL